MPTTHTHEPRRALLVHGINGGAAVWWRLSADLAAASWAVTTLDLRGHGTAPRADSYTFDDYADDLPAGPWDLVVGHSLGGSIVVRAAISTPGWAGRIALLDPLLALPNDVRDSVVADQLAELDATIDELELEKPHWHPLDREAKIAAAQLADSDMVQLTFVQNDPWNLEPDAAALEAPTLIIGGDPSVYSMLDDAMVARIVAANDRVTYVRIDGAGHSPHRDKPFETHAALFEWLDA
jgi:pimeloyl-ACP methyl ester carboxylesterase